MSSVVYQKLEKPTRFLFVAPLLLMMEIVVFFATLIVSREPLLAIALIVPAHLYCIGLTTKEPHINNILRNFFARLFATRSLKQPQNKTPLIFQDDDVEFYYEL